jgi:hypothetical protein
MQHWEVPSTRLKEGVSKTGPSSGSFWHQERPANYPIVSPFIFTIGVRVSSLGLDGAWEHRWATAFVAESLKFQFRLFEIVSGTVGDSWRPLGLQSINTPPSEAGTGHSRLRSADPVSSKVIFL